MSVAIGQYTAHGKLVQALMPEGTIRPGSPCRGVLTDGVDFYCQDCAYTGETWRQLIGHRGAHSVKVDRKKPGRPSAKDVVPNTIDQIVALAESLRPQSQTVSADKYAAVLKRAMVAEAKLAKLRGALL